MKGPNYERVAEERRKTLLKAFEVTLMHTNHPVCLCGCERAVPITRIVATLAKGRGPISFNDTCAKKIARHRKEST